MANVVTTLSSMYDPEVMADAVKAIMTNAIRFSPMAKIDSTLQGQPGSVVTVPIWGYIGDATALSENTAGESVAFSATHAHYTVAKAFRAVDLTDEAVLSGVGDPIGEATRQLGLALAGKIDADCVTALSGIAGGMTSDGDNLISYDAIVDGLAKFGEVVDGDGWLIINPAQLATLRKDSDFIAASALGDSVKTTGVIGQIAGLKVVVSSRITSSGSPLEYANYIVRPGALTIFLKTDPRIETDRDIKSKVTTVAADQHYVVALTDTSKAVKLLCRVTAP